MEALIVLTGALTGPTGPTVPKKPLPTSSSYPQEPVLENYPTHEPNNSPQLDGIGGYIGEGSRGGHTDEDILWWGEMAPLPKKSPDLGNSSPVLRALMYVASLQTFGLALSSSSRRRRSGTDEKKRTGEKRLKRLKRRKLGGCGQD
jgi:hypothetical protein